MKFLNEHTHILHGLKPVDKNDPENQCTAVELALPSNFSEKAKACWHYFRGSAYIFEYGKCLVVTDESLMLTSHGDGRNESIGFPRWVCDSWKELENILEDTYDELVYNGFIE